MAIIALIISIVIIASLMSVTQKTKNRDQTQNRPEIAKNRIYRETDKLITVIIPTIKSDK